MESFTHRSHGLEQLDALVQQLQLTHVYIVETIWIERIEQVQEYHDRFVSQGFEGVMIRDPEGPYERNKRSKYLQKYKEMMDQEFPIIGFTEGTGDEAGSVLWIVRLPNDRVVHVRPRGTREQRQEWFQHGSDFIGKPLTVLFQGWTEDGSLRFPVGKAIREDILLP